MQRILIVATKRTSSEDGHSATVRYVNLCRRPRTIREAVEKARVITKTSTENGSNSTLFKGNDSIRNTPAMTKGLAGPIRQPPLVHVVCDMRFRN